MAALTRRAFLGTASGALGACVLSNNSSWAVPPSTRRDDLTRVYMVILPTAPSRDDTDVEPISNPAIVQRLKELCEGVDFDVRDLTAGATMQSVLNEAKELKRSGYDGVVVCGWPRDYDLLRTGVPTINVAVVNDFMNIPYPLLQEHKVISASLDPWRFCADPNVSERMFQDLADKIKLFKALKQMKRDHILTVTDSPWVNVTYGDMLKNIPADYNEKILGAIEETFGVTGDEDRNERSRWGSRGPASVAQRSSASQCDRQALDRQGQEDEQYDGVRSRAICQSLPGDEDPDAEIQRHGDGVPHPLVDRKSASRGLCHAGTGDV